jgi:L-lactate dehydrogenase complex protein LldG
VLFRSQASRPGGGYLLSLLAPLHIALVKASDVLPGLAELPAALADPARFPAGPPASLCVIAGPSKTGDIEAIMIRGVHGPGRVEVVLWG